MHQTADEFFEEVKKNDPDRWEEVEERYPVNSKYDEKRFRHGEPPGRRQARNGKSGGVPKDKKRKFTLDEWAEYRKAKKKYIDDWWIDNHYAEEQNRGF